MERNLRLATILLMLTALGCDSGADSLPAGSTDSERIARDLSTPEGAILCLEDAYRAGDIEAAVRCKDFTIEATLILQNLEQDFSDDQEILSKTTEVLELGFRSEMTNGGFPDFQDVVSTFPDKRPYQGRDDMVEITEVCRHADGSTTQNQLVVAETPDGWKVVAVPE